MKKVSGLHDHIGFWLRAVSNTVSIEFANSLSEVGITVPEWVMLRELREHESASIGFIGAFTGMTKGAVSKIVARLLKKKLITVRISETDRRSQIVTLASAGQVLVPDLAQIADANDDKFFSCLSAHEKKSLMKILRKIHKNNNLSGIPLN